MAAPKRKREPARGGGGKASKKAKKGKRAAAAAAALAAVEAASLEEENPEIAKLARQQKVGGNITTFLEVCLGVKRVFSSHQFGTPLVKHGSKGAHLPKTFTLEVFDAPLYEGNRG